MVSCPDLNRFIAEGQTAPLLMKAAPEPASYAKALEAFLECNRESMIS